MIVCAVVSRMLSETSDGKVGLYGSFWRGKAALYAPVKAYYMDDNLVLREFR